MKKLYNNFIKLENKKINNLEQKTQLFFNKNNIKIKNKKYIIKLNNDIILFKWEQIKSYNNNKLLTLIYKFRKFYIDTLLQIIKDYIKCNNNNNCIIYSQESTNITSDYDITITNTHNLPSQIMFIFNNYFNKFWNETSSIIFDTNIYASDYIIKINSNYKILNNNSNNIIQYIYPRNENKYLNLIINSQHEIALIKSIKYLFSIYNNKLVCNNDLCHNIIKEINKNKFLNKLLKIAKKRYIKLLTINNKIVNINNINISNQIYYDKILIVEKKRIEYNNNIYSDQKCVDLYHSIENSLVFAQDAYFSQGAIFHVVGKIQKLADLPITHNQYIDSIIENMGNFIKVINHNYNKIDNTQSLIDSSKYLARIFNAILSINNNSNNTKLIQIYKILDIIRIEFRTKTYNRIIINNILKQYKFNISFNDIDNDTKIINYFINLLINKSNFNINKKNDFIMLIIQIINIILKYI